MPMERVAVAPFDDSVVLFLTPGGAVQDALGWNVQLEVQAPSAAEDTPTARPTGGICKALEPQRLLACLERP